jgi:hypothetical protein
MIRETLFYKSERFLSAFNSSPIGLDLAIYLEQDRIIINSIKPQIEHKTHNNEALLQYIILLG